MELFEYAFLTGFNAKIEELKAKAMTEDYGFYKKIN